MGNFTIKGKITEIFPEETFNSSTKTEFVIKTSNNKELKFDAWNDNADPLWEMSPGTEVQVSFFPESKFWQKGGKYFTNLTATSIVDVNIAKDMEHVRPTPKQEEEQDYTDDLPF